jgi:sialic acid synthase SpsE
MTFLVAEIGVNWDGDLGLAKNMMEAAKESGCDAVKFQAFDESIVSNHPEKNRLLKSSIDKENIDSINEISESIGVEWFCTPMIVEAVDLLKPYMNKFKIRESDSHILLENKTNPLIETILNSSKEIIISSQQNPKNSKYYDDPKINWLYCVPKYPCNLSDLDFGDLKDFNGYSNHCPDIVAPIRAASLGAEIVEVHITSNRDRNFLDNPVSFDYSELFQLVKQIRNIKK